MTNQGKASAPSSVDDLTNLFGGVSLSPGQAHALVNAILSASATTAAASSSGSAPASLPAAPPPVAIPAAPAIPPPPPAVTSPFVPGGPFPPPGQLLAGQGFYVIPDTDPGPYYVVTRGQRVGVFAGWSVVSPWVIRVQTAAYHRVASILEGVQCMHEAIEDGTAWVLP
ncbi:uncharacterized protein ARMOST_22514 [Armillaria ostoyae]|uniref:Uncharacterized protein n=1 Tax=Armillaria ostoyae TaxID=47428 RepID=A0A284SD27_ARMOS|nr:uncharacterized protein ARMOST_22514 [Armillaria ostoyae]